MNDQVRPQRDEKLETRTQAATHRWEIAELRIGVEIRSSHQKPVATDSLDDLGGGRNQGNDPPRRGAQREYVSLGVLKTDGKGGLGAQPALGLFPAPGLPAVSASSLAYEEQGHEACNCGSAGVRESDGCRRSNGGKEDLHSPLTVREDPQTHHLLDYCRRL
jgi:hypothetical protein